MMHTQMPRMQRPSAVNTRALEEERVAGAIRTDFILSAEIMAISLATITSPDILTQAIVLFSVSVLVTAGVYGVVAIIVKADDFGVYLAQRGGTLTSCHRPGHRLGHAAVPQDA